MNFSRNKVWILPLLAVMSYPLWKPALSGFLAPRESKITFAKKTATTDERNLHLYGVTMSQSSGDKLEMVLKADSVATGGAGKNEYFFKEIDCQLYDDQGLSTLITGGEALLATDKKLITIIDDVHVVTGDEKYRIITDALRYFTQYKVAKTATAVRFWTDGKEICGNSMMYNLRTGAFRVGGGVICDF
ncbi:MAG: LPS export ABC transporter periplasmic protein LptC [Thermodesulfobacteriota bacterium]